MRGQGCSGLTASGQQDTVIRFSRNFQCRSLYNAMKPHGTAEAKNSNRGRPNKIIAAIYGAWIRIFCSSKQNSLTRTVYCLCLKLDFTTISVLLPEEDLSAIPCWDLKVIILFHGVHHLLLLLETLSAFLSRFPLSLPQLSQANQILQK